MFKIENLFGILTPGAMYPMKTIKTLYADSFDNVTKSDLKVLSMKIRSESSNSKPLIQKVKIGKTLYYKLNPNIDFVSEKERIQAQTVQGMASSLLKVVLSESEKHIINFIDNDMMDKFSVLIQSAVEKEFSDEILPLLIKNMDIKIKKSTSLTKGKFKLHLKEILQDSINKLKETE